MCIRYTESQKYAFGNKSQVPDSPKPGKRLFRERYFVNNSARNFTVIAQILCCKGFPEPVFQKKKQDSLNKKKIYF